jgi:hypothetical protein
VKSRTEESTEPYNQLRMQDACRHASVAGSGVGVTSMWARRGGNTLILFRKEGKYVRGHDLQEANVSRPIFTKTTLGMAKPRSTIFGDPKLQFSQQRW